MASIAREVVVPARLTVAEEVASIKVVVSAREVVVALLEVASIARAVMVLDEVASIAIVVVDLVHEVVVPAAVV